MVDCQGAGTINAVFLGEVAHMKSKKVKTPKAKEGREARPIRVLFVDDSVQDAQLMVHHLESNGYDVHYQRVCSATKMNEALGREKWDLVLCDYVMPGFGVVPAIELLKNKK